jgi:hypothetical protein
MRTRRSLPGAVLLLAGITGTAFGQAGPAYDPLQLPALQGKVAQYSLTPRSDVDGLILDDGTEIHLPPHLGAQLVFAVKPGDRVTVHGLKARAIAMMQAISVTNDATGATVTDNGPGGPPGPRDRGTDLSAQGHIKTQLHGPRGELNGVLLEDGTIVRLPPDEADRLAAQLAPGQPLYVEGNGIAGPLGKVIAAQEIGPSQSQLAQVQGSPPPPRDPRPERRGPPPR